MLCTSVNTFYEWLGGSDLFEVNNSSVTKAVSVQCIAVSPSLRAMPCSFQPIRCQPYMQPDVYV